MYDKLELRLSGRGRLLSGSDTSPCIQWTTLHLLCKSRNHSFGALLCLWESKVGLEYPSPTSTKAVMLDVVPDVRDVVCNGREDFVRLGAVLQGEVQIPMVICQPIHL